MRYESGDQQSGVPTSGSTANNATVTCVIWHAHSLTEADY